MIPVPKLPDSAKRYFWDINVETLDVAAHPRFVIERLLEYGDFPELKWLFREFSRDEIVDVIKRTRRLSRRRASAWANYFDIRRDEVLCLSKPSPSQPAAIWPY